MRIRPSLALALLVAVSSAAAAAPVAVPARPEQLRYPPLAFEVPRAEALRHELAGGVVAYVVPDHALPLVNVTLYLRTGRFREPAGRPGIAELTARLARVGGAASLSAAEFDERADFLAARIGTVAGESETRASLNVLTSALAPGLDLLFDMLREPRFDGERLAVEKGKLLEALKQRNDDADDLQNREWGWLLYGREHIVSRKVTAAELDAIGRDDLIDFHRRTWGPDHLVIAVSGDVEPAPILAELERRLAGWRASEPAPWPPRGAEFTPRPGVYHVEKEIPQGKVLVGHRSLQVEDWSNPDLDALSLMNDILGGGGFTSRLTKRVRSDEGLAYGAFSSYGLGIHWPTAFVAGFASKNSTVAYALEIVLEEIDRMRREPVTAEELQVAKASFVDTFPRAFESAEQVAGTFARDELIGRPHDYWHDYRRRIQAVDADDVMRVARAYLHPDELVVLVVGKWEEIAPGDPEGRAAMSQFAGGAVEHLPLRDPLTLEPLAGAP